MFFGRRKPEAVSVDKLGQFLNSQFERKLGSLGSRSQAIIDRLNQAMRRFGDACNNFEKLEAEPNVEGRYSASINYIKTQKDRYASGLKHILDGTRLEAGDAANSYDRYRHVLSDLEGMVKRVLEMNASFKIVLYCYSNYLWDFRGSFSEIEKLAGALKGELDSRSDDFSEYSAVAERVSRLNAYREEFSALNRGAETIKTETRPSNDALDKNGADLSAKLEDKRAELAKLSRERSELHNKINSMVLPLERASKKLDHLSASKSKLHVFVEDPVKTINNESEYGEFKTLLRELNEKIRAGSIDLRNGDKMSETVSMLLGSDLYSMIASLRSIQQKESDIKGEIGALEGDLNEIKTERTSSERHAQKMADMKGRMAEIERGEAAEKGVIEKLFSDNYGVLISITA
jgi:predicted nuclease with TOPRIM domain